MSGRHHISYASAVQQGLIEGTISGCKTPRLDQSILSQLRVIDEQDHVQSIDWDGLPKGITKSLIERMLYYRPSLCMFYLKANNRFYILPYTGHGLDCYGRFTTATPIIWNGSLDAKDERPWIEGLNLNIVYDMVDINEWDPDMMDNCCVILNDYTPQLSKTLISRQILNEGTLKTMSELIPFMRTSLANSVGINGVNVQSQDEAAMVREASRSSVAAALTGDKWIPLNSTMQLSDLKGANGVDASAFMAAYQSLENYRKATHGIASNGMQAKAAHLLGAEQQMNADGSDLIMADRVYNRQQFCLIANSIWGTMMWSNSSESASGIDRNMNGVLEEDESEDLTDGTNNNGISEQVGDDNA